MITADEFTPDYVADLASQNGMTIQPKSVRFNEAGLDYLVAFATAKDGRRWVLRIPRRPDVSAKISDEAKILELVKNKISAAVPDWRIRNRSLIAYPELPGELGLTVEDGEPVWHFDRESPAYCASLGRLIAQLQRIGADEARAKGVPVLTPAELRAEWRSNLAAVSAEFRIADELMERWTAWLGDDSYWPDFTAFVHGELYPAHLLLDEENEIRSVLDWTTARVGDPAADFSLHHMMSTPLAFDLTVRAFRDEGGRVPPRLGEHCAELVAAGPVVYGMYALQTGHPDHQSVAAAQLDPSSA
ncbi:macrolide 2'-phosphotransferase [Arthrobacter sp. NPDC089319]|uniref:macrolide 2'-phosphotransferase n=1 Tax=Arthrobacter sp. NPDC089319 TaxID=3155915 RepID=UPI003442AF0D